MTGALFFVLLVAESWALLKANRGTSKATPPPPPNIQVVRKAKKAQSELGEVYFFGQIKVIVVI